MNTTNLAVLRRLRRTLACQSNVIDIARTVHMELASVLCAPIWLMSTYDPTEQAITVIWQMHDDQELPGGSFPLGDGLTSRVIRSASSTLIRQWSREGPAVRVQYATAGTSALPESSVAVPILSASEVLGVLCVQDYRPQVFDQRDVHLLETAARAMAPALRRLSAGTDCPGFSSSDGINTAAESAAQITVDGDGQVVEYSHAARRLLEAFDAGITFGQPLVSAIANSGGGTPPRIARGLAEAMAQLQAGANSVTVEIASPRVDVGIRLRPGLLSAADCGPERGVITLLADGATQPV